MAVHEYKLENLANIANGKLAVTLPFGDEPDNSQ